MMQYETYVFILCFIVFVFLTVLSIACLNIIYKLSVRLIHAGAEDEKIIKEQTESQAKKTNAFAKVLENVVTAIVCLVLLAAFVISTAIAISKDAPDSNVPTYRVVNTGSMAKKNANNQYLFDNDINNQIQTFDLIRTEKLPKEDDLKLYDIVVYEMDDVLVVHRIVEIEEPNAAHPDKRYFRLQGDAVDSPDRFPVTYEQMRAIYSGDRIPFIGSFVLFMQSPAGYLCILLVVIAIIATPIINKSILKHRKDRYTLITADQSNDLIDSEEK